MTAGADRSAPRRGWVYLADLGAARGTEPGKARPVLVLQTDLLNRVHPSTVILPLTTSVQSGADLLRVHFKKGEAGLGADSDALIDQPRAVDNRRLRRPLGAAPARRLAEVESALAVLLDLPGA